MSTIGNIIVGVLLFIVVCKIYNFGEEVYWKSKRVQKFNNRGYAIPNYLIPFLGFWVYKSETGLERENINIEYAGEDLLNISKVTIMNKYLPPLGDGPGFITDDIRLSESPPPFRAIPISDKKIKIISSKGTYTFPPSNMEIISTSRGMALKFQGKMYYMEIS